MPCGCGQCMSCRINKSRMWSNRIMLERIVHQDASFVTLTYKDEELKHITEWNADVPLVGNLVLTDAQKWLKRLRKMVDNPIRYFLVGEYGENTQRPHYHAAVFGLPNCIYGRTRPGNSCCGSCDLVKRSWKLGHSYLGELNSQSASYIAGYVTKKWTKEDLWTKEKLKGRRTEFARMSLNPGIGATAIKQLINFTEPTRAGNILHECLDAPVVLRNSGSTLPLGRYLRRKWRESLGRQADPPKQLIEEYAREMQKLYEEAKALSLQQGVPKLFITPKFEYQKSTKQKIKNLDARTKIYYKGKII